MSVVAAGSSHSASMVGSSPPLPSIPPSEMPEIPATLRLGTNLLGLGLGPLSIETGSSLPSPVATELSASTIRSTPPKPSHLTPVRTDFTSSPLSSPSVPIVPQGTASPLSYRSGTSRLRQPRGDSPGWVSTVSLSQSSGTITPTKEMSTRQPMSQRQTPSNDWGWKQRSVGKGKEGRPPLFPSLSSGSGIPLSKKRSSGQLLSGIGKGLGRMGSVMRRNTVDEAPETPSKGSPNGNVDKQRGANKTWLKKGTIDDELLPEEAEPSESFGPAQRSKRIPLKSTQQDEGDPGIGRPFNTEHDLHVSPSLEDLPPAWVQTLREQGLSEQDLLLIAAARRRQASVEHIPISPGNGSKASRCRGNGKSGLAAEIGLPGQSAVGRHSIGEPRVAGPLDVPSLSPDFRTMAISPEEATSTQTPPRPIDKSSWQQSGSRVVTTQAAVHHDYEDAVSAPGLADFRGGRRRTPKRSKRLSDQLRCFSQFDLGGEEGWAASLLEAMNAEQEESRPEMESGGSRNLWSSSLPGDPSVDDREAELLPAPTIEESTAASQTTGQDTEPNTPQRTKTIKRIPIPALLPPPTQEAPLDFVEALQPHSLGQVWPTPPPRSPRRTPVRTTSTPSLLYDQADLDPIGRSLDSFGVFHSRNKSSVDFDGDLVTPSSSNVHEYTRRSPDPTLNSPEDVDETDGGSILDFGKALQEFPTEITPASSTGHLADEYMSSRQGSHSTPALPHDSSSAASYAREHTARRPIYSVPVSISSLPSRSPTPELPLVPGSTYAWASHHGTSRVVHQSGSGTAPQTPQRSRTREQRISLSSTFSSDSGHAHEATVQMAYKVLGRFREEEYRRTGGPVVRRIDEEGGCVEMERDGRCSAIFALDDAARRIAGGQRESAGL